MARGVRVALRMVALMDAVVYYSMVFSLLG